MFPQSQLDVVRFLFLWETFEWNSFLFVIQYPIRKSQVNVQSDILQISNQAINDFQHVKIS